jgi:tetratricopeptide (TPR) repeat protein
MLAWLLAWWRARQPAQREVTASATGLSVAISGDNTNSPIQIGLSEDGVRRVFEQTFDRKLAEISREKGVPEAPLREVLKRLGETEVAEAEIPDRLAKAADELLRLRADLTRLTNDRPEFAAIRARASAAIDRGDFDAARSALREGQRRTDEMLEELSRTKAGFLADEARVDRLQLNYDAACAKFAEAARLDPDNVSFWIELGDLWTLRGSLGEAKSAFSDARDAAARTRNEYELAWSHSRIGDVQMAQGNLAAALIAYRDSLAIIGRLAQSDPGNAGWQRDLSVSYESVGDVQVAQGDLAGALTSYRDGLAIRDRLAQSDPGNTDWRRDLSVSYDRIGNLQVKQGNLAGAFKSYGDGFTIIDRLAQSDPVNAGWQHYLAVSHAKIADALKNTGRGGEALESLRQGHAIMVRLTALSPENVQWKLELDWLAEQIPELSQ